MHTNKNNTLDHSSSLSFDEQKEHPEWVGLNRKGIYYCGITQQYQLDENDKIIPYAVGSFI